jgi:hypothetical protein
VLKHAVAKITAQRPVALLPPRRLRRQLGSPKRLSHPITAGGRGRSETFLRSRRGCCGRPGFQSLIEPHCQREPTCARQLRSYAVAPVVALQAQGQATQGRDLSTLAPLRVLRARTPEPAAFWVDLQHLDTNDIAGLRDFVWVSHISIGHRGDVHQPVLTATSTKAPKPARLVTAPSRTIPGKLRLPMSSRIQCNASSALPLLHRITR